MTKNINASTMTKGAYKSLHSPTRRYSYSYDRSKQINYHNSSFAFSFPLFNGGTFPPNKFLCTSVSYFAMIKPQASTSFLFYFLTLLSLSSLHLHNDGTLTLIDHAASEPSHSRRNYIVRFFDYKHADFHRNYLRRSIKSDGWDWIERRNPAAKFPTDFGVVEIEEAVKMGVIEEIEGLSSVKDVLPDFSYTRTLLEEEILQRESEFCNVKKKPGKIFTKISFEEKEEGDGSQWSVLSNQSISWRRHLLGKVS